MSNPTKKPQAIHSDHRKRMKSQFINNGASMFEDHNMLELLLFYAIPRVDTNEIAHKLINHFGSLAEVFDAPYEELIKVEGVAENSATLIKMVPSLAQRYAVSKHSNVKVFDNPKVIGEYFVNKFIGCTEEKVYLMLLDSSLQLIYCALLANGTATSANVSIRGVVNLVVKHSACSVVLAHNHPRGLVLPSTEDLTVTSKLKYALRPLEIQLIEHIIVSGNEYIPLIADGYIKSEI